ncbi:hypothetical protein PMG11_01034 [Penicillium brasilianum]|uniref:Wings apart-like protein C-terminal domain-containing protein n=1 Tax=Penicillium brasilianum TaxID=104259 RepID=A0A0F7TD87_PENBI|nr:hypothetical protein PMG11_01034 [Penicillium brasilianum]
MEHTRSQSRRLVTYGSSTRNQPRTITASAAKESLDPAGKMRASHSTTNQKSASEHRNKQARPSETVQATKVSGALRPAEQDSIYDLPSSDEEDLDLAARRKRRRYGVDTNGGASYFRNSLAVRTPPDSEAKGGSQDHSIKLNPTIPPLKVDSPRATRHVSGRRGAQPQQSDKTSAKNSRKPAGDLPVSAFQRTEPTSLPPLDTRGQSSHSKAKQASYGSIVPSPIMEQPGSPSFQTQASTRGGNTTPTRRRLIDSLGTRGQLVDASPSNAAVSQPPSPFTPHSPSRPKALPPQSTRVDSQATDSTQESTVAVSPHLTGTRVTYARQRSFLDDLCLTDDLTGHNMAAAFEQDGLSTSQSRRFDDLPRTRLFEIEEVNNDDGSIRSIHELRRAGGNARYRGAVESIFEDIEDPHVSISGRCNSFVQICDKLLDSKQARQFVECNFDRRLVDCLSRNLDTVSASLALCVFGLASLGRSLPYVFAAAAWPKLIHILPPLLGIQDDLCAVVRARGSNLSKAAQRSVQNIAPQIHTALFADASALRLSPCVLALHCLRVTISAFQAKGEIPDDLPAPVLSQLVKILVSESSHLQEKPTDDAESLHVLILGLSILEVQITSGDSAQEDQRDAFGILSGMHSLLRLDKEASSIRQQVQTLYLRVVLNTTNSNPTLCDKFATAAMIDELAMIAIARFGELTEDTLTHENNSLDTVILALGALINLVEQREASRTMFLTSGSGAVSILDQLLQLFLARVDSTSQAHSVLEVHHNVAVGYLAVLLLALCLHTGARMRIKESLRPNGLTIIMSTVNEFLQYHQKIEQELHPAQANKEASGFLVRLQDLINEIQRID